MYCSNIDKIVYRVSQKSVPCANENNSENVCSSGKMRYFWEPGTYNDFFYLISVKKGECYIGLKKKC